MCTYQCVCFVRSSPPTVVVTTGGILSMVIILTRSGVNFHREILLLAPLVIMVTLISQMEVSRPELGGFKLVHCWWYT